MCERQPPELSPALRAQTLARFEAHRKAWQANPTLRISYGRWYGQVLRSLPPKSLGPWVEVGSGPGFARELIPDLVLTDIVQAPWHNLRASADCLPFADGSVGALVLFDVLHHVAAPVAFFAEATRVLVPGGRIVLCEPFISPVSGWVYRHFHPEPVDMRADPLGRFADGGEVRDPFESNQAIPTLLFFRDPGRRALAEQFPGLAIVHRERLAGLSYPASGGFSHAPLLPLSLWRALFSAEHLLPEVAFRWMGFRSLVVLERRL